MDAAVAAQKNVIESLHPSQRISAENLVRYLIMRSEDIRSLQDQLHLAGLSSLASSESHILFQLQAIQERLGREYPQEERSNCDYHYAQEIIRQRSTQLFGSKSDTSIPFVFVTFDTEFASNSLLVKKLLLEGMNIARINCAHDRPEVRENMIELVHMASDKTGLPCKIYMDLAGPKMRTSVPAAGRKEGRIRLETGQEVLLADPDVRFDPSEPVIGCSEPGIIRQLHAGERVLFDDGLIESCVVSRKDSVAVVKIIRNSSKKLMLKAGKGMNFPDSRLNIPELTEYDRSILPFACRHADLIGYSFVRSTIGILELQDLLSAFPQRPHIVLKIETPEAVRNFPALLVQGMAEDVFGVMIARGDLAVEIGFGRMSEVQEEITWISEAAHVPVIWAAQVLETLNKSGVATRSEITDASHSSIAECVMINKGEYIVDVLRTLRDILVRSGSHHAKKRYPFRTMQIARHYFAEEQNDVTARKPVGFFGKRLSASGHSRPVLSRS